MYVTIFSLFIALITKSSGLSIPFIQDVFLQPLTDLSLNITIRLNSSCKECLCEELISKNKSDNLALNCFGNGTCLFFQSFPLSYKIKASSGTRLYFLQNTYPNTRKCCMPNIIDLLTRLQNAVAITINLILPPAAFGYDEVRPYEAAVTGWGIPILCWFNPITMLFIRYTLTDTSYTLTIYVWFAYL